MNQNQPSVGPKGLQITNLSIECRTKRIENLNTIMLW